MLSPIAYGLATVLAVAIIAIGARFLWTPRAAANDYGVPATPDGHHAYLSAKGLRDIASGVVGLVLIAFTDAHAVAWFMVAVALVPLGDTLIVLRNGGSRATAFGIHFATAAAVLATAGLLFAASDGGQ